jgi:hypothetical protein
MFQKDKEEAEYSPAGKDGIPTATTCNAITMRELLTFTSLTSGQRLSRHFGRVTTLWETLDGRGDFIVLTAPNKDTLPRTMPWFLISNKDRTRW